MPDDLAPGVFVEESSDRPKSIEGVRTSAAAIVGPTRIGPHRGLPVVTASYSEFMRTFGDSEPLKFGDDMQMNHTALAAQAFFENGGTRLHVKRVLAGGAGVADETTNCGLGVPSVDDYAGTSDDQNGSTGLAAMEDIEEISIVLAAAAVALDASSHTAVVNAVQSHCERMRYRFGIVDSREKSTVAEVRAFRDQFSSSRMALYYPWVRAPRIGGGEHLLPPSGFIAGVYARTDMLRGVHKPPVNELVVGALGFEHEIDRVQQDLLNPIGVNCLRSFPGRGHRVWGGRTLSDDPEWKHVNVRRYSLFLERSIDRGTQWVIFEPNGETLWSKVAATVDAFLYNEWRNGRFIGSSPTDAYFVRCDRSTMTQNDLDNGRLVCQLGVALLRPSEFVIFRIAQRTADA